MINMGLKTADICDLDNRPANLKMKDMHRENPDIDMLSDLEGRNMTNDSFINEHLENSQQYQALLDPKNYPFYQKIKRNLYIMDQLLNDENNLQFLGAKEAERIKNSDAPASGGFQDLEGDKRGKSPSQPFSQRWESGARSGPGRHRVNSRFGPGGNFACSSIMKWSFKNNPNAEAFRRSMLPFYLLKDDSGWKHPRYIEMSNLSKNLSENTSVSITIYLSNEISESIDSVLKYITKDDNNRNKGNLLRKPTKIQKPTKAKSKTAQPIEIKNFYLLKTAQSLIEEAVQQVHAKYFPDDSNDTGKQQQNLGYMSGRGRNAEDPSQPFQGVKVLKFRNQEAYVYGETQLIYFSDIREHIKNNQEIQLVLCNVDSSNNSMSAAIQRGLGVGQGTNQATNNLHRFSINQQMKMFPPMVNTLYLEKQIENDMKVVQVGTGSPTKEMSRSFNSLDFHSVIEEEMKAKLIQVFNQASSFFWYAPQGLLTERYVSERQSKLSDHIFPGNGMSYTMKSTDRLQWGQRNHFFNNDFAHQNNIKASWYSLRSQENKFPYLKSGHLETEFILKLRSVGNLVKMIDDLHTGKNNVHDIYEYKYWDTTYEMKFGYDLVVDTDEVRTQIRQYKTIETNLKQQEKDILTFVDQTQAKYHKECSKLLNQNQYQERMQQNQKLFDFQNRSSNTTALFKTFQNQNFNILKGNHKKKTGHEKKAGKKPKTSKITPRYIQIEAALYLGCERISQFTYSTPKLFGQHVDFYDEEMLFCPINDAPSSGSYFAQQFQQQKQFLKISNLPSNTRLVLQIILLPETFSLAMTQRQLPNREGYIYGSVALPIYDNHRRLLQGDQRLLAWPLQKFDERFICMHDCYKFKRPEDILRNFNNNLDIVIQMPKYHTDVFWDLGEDISMGSAFQMQEKDFFENNMNPNLASTLSSTGRASIADSHLMSLRMTMDGDSTSSFDQVRSEQVESETRQIQILKTLIHEFPREKAHKDYNRHLIQRYRYFVPNIAMYIRSIDFTNKQEVVMCYNFLQTADQAKNCKPEDALALLDAEFGDERIRLFAVTKLSYLNDTYLSLYIPQLVQALKYEVHHKSALGEFLLERSLENTGVVGHAFFWSLRAGLHEFRSYERFYLILERFLMCCGNYKNELFRQNTVNKALISVHKKVQQRINEAKKEKEQDKSINIKKHAEQELYKALKEQEFIIKLTNALVLNNNYHNITKVNGGNSEYVRTATKNDDLISERSGGFGMRPATGNRRKGSEKLFFSNHYVGPIFDRHRIDQCVEDHQAKYQGATKKEKEQGLEVVFQDELIEWKQESIIFPFLPKKHIKTFTESSRLFMSKQVPLLLVAEVRGQDENDMQQVETIKILFKYGDDLRQDNLVLQFFRIMDEMWMEQNMNMEIVRYKVLETGYQVGYIEFVDNSEVITSMHKWRGFWRGAFEERSIYEYFKYEVYPAIFKQNLKNLRNEKKNQSLEKGQRLIGFSIVHSKSEVNPKEQKQGCEFSLDPDDDIILKAMKNTDKQLKKMHSNFIKSLAGQCVATYTLGIRDRHSANFMINKQNMKFFHIDFGHFLDHYKSKLGFKRDREPFIYSKELHYLLTNLSRLYKDFKQDEVTSIQKVVPRKFLNQANGLNADGTKIEKKGPSVVEVGGVAIKKEDQEDQYYHPVVSQRKLFRVKNWAKEDKKPEDPLKRKTFRQDRIGAHDKHDFVLLTDTEQFKRDDVEVLEGIHHLTTIPTEQQPAVYNLNKIDLSQTSGELEIEKHDFEEFQLQCCTAFQILRERAHVFINLLQLMLVSDIDELQQNDIKYLINAMFLDMSEEQAQSEFQKLIKKALHEPYRKVDNFFHIYNDLRKGQK